LGSKRCQEQYAPFPKIAASFDTLSAQPSDGKPAGAINAEAVVKQNCISCHGDTLDGKGSPNKNLQKVGARLTKEQIAAQITNGGGGMSALGKVLSAEEINAVAEWLAQKK
jgi:cytochrome c551